jgi:hypothetical protein
MVRKLLVGLALVTGLVLCSMGAWAADEKTSTGKEFVGTWYNDADGYREVWIIRHMTSGFDVAGTYTRLNTTPGSFSSENVRFADGKLMFTQKFGPNPPKGWADGAKITVTHKDDGLHYTWQVSDTKGERALKSAK